ncbi:MAG: Sec-independent protein translocase subunit TatA/TatB [Limisphaerales bacterium]
MNTLFAVFGVGGGEIILVLAVVLLLFGAKKLPELAKGLGHGIREFKKATNDVTEEFQKATDEPSYTAPKKLPPEGSAPHQEIVGVPPPETPIAPEPPRAQ